MTVVISASNQGGDREKNAGKNISFLSYPNEQYRRFRSSIFVLVARPATLSVRDTQCRTSRRVVTDASYYP